MKALKLILLLCWSGLSIAQNQFRFKTFTIEDGLSQNSINDIFQDSDGFLWFATQDGLNRYDGYDFKHYNVGNDDGYSLCDNFLWGMQEDENGYLWICSRSGLNRLNRNTGQVTHFLCSPIGEYRADNQTLNILIANGYVHASFTYGKLCRFPVDLGRNEKKVIIDKKEYELKLATAKYIYSSANNNGKLFFGCDSGLIIKQGGSTKMYDYPQPDSRFILQGKAIKKHNGDLWIGLNTGLFKFVNGKFEEYVLDSKKSIEVSAINVDNLNRIWVGTKRGIYIISGNNIIQHITEQPNQPNKLISNYVHSLFCDKSGLIWIGTANKGLQCYDPSTEEFKFLTAKEGLNDPLVWASMTDSQGNLWIGTNNGLNKVLYKNEKSFSQSSFATENIETVTNVFSKELEGARISCLFEMPDGNIWAGTSNKGLFILNLQSNTIRNIKIENGNIHSNKFSALIIHENFVWAATQNGVFQFDFEGNLVSEPNIDNDSQDPPDGYFLCMYKDKEGILWFGANYGVCYYESSTKQYKKILHNPNEPSKGPNFNFVTGFCEIGDYLWMATFGGGVSRMHKQTKTFTHYTKENGLANNVCSGILPDAKNNVWVSTNKGLSKISAKGKITNYSVEDGLVYDEFAIGSFSKNEKGELFFGTAEGLVGFNPNQIQNNEYEPGISIISLAKNYKLQPNWNASTNEIHIEPGDKTFSIQFAGLSFRNPKENRYAYIMQGFDKDWAFTESGDRRATYSNLPYGEYIFKVKASNDDGLWSNHIKQLKVFVHPPFYATWWFRTVASLAVLLTLVLFIRYLSQRKLRKKLRELEIKQKIQQERSRISKDLHDNIGSQITYLISSLDNAAYQLNGNGKEVAEKLNELSSFSRNTMHQLRETIWVINKDEVSLQELKGKVNDMMQRYQDQLPANHSVTMGGENVTLKPTIAITIYRIIQESVANCIKHANATELNIALEVVEGNRLNIAIKDNGNGGAKEKEGHYGIKNMKTRMQEIGGILNIRTVNGTSILLSLNLTNVTKIGHMPY